MVETTSNWWMSRTFRAVSGSYHLIAGLALVLLMTFAAPSFGYYPCAILLTVSALFWKWPLQAASFSLPFACVFAYALYALQIWHWAGDASIAVGLIVLVAFSFVPCVIVLASGRVFFRPMAVAMSLIFVSFAVDRLFTNRVEIRSVEMGWTSDGKTPWGADTQVDSSERTPVIVYVRAGGGYCYDAIFYEPLKLRLEKLGKPTVVVQYNVFRDFGSERGYNVRSIEGFQFNDAKHELIQYGEGYGGTTLVPRGDDGHTFKYGPSNCPR